MDRVKESTETGSQPILNPLVDENDDKELATESCICCALIAAIIS